MEIFNNQTDPAFRKIGNDIANCATWEQAIKKSDLDWQVEKRQLEYKGEPVPAWGTFRLNPETKDLFLGAVGPDYTAIQNKDAFSFVDTIVNSEGGAHYEIAGHLYNSKRIWCLARLPEQLHIKGSDDVMLPYLLFHNRHDGKNSAMVKLTNTRPVCSNTLNMALKGAGAFLKIYHYKNAKQKLEEAQKAFGEIKGEITDLNTLLNTLAAHKLTMPQLQEILNGTFKELETSAVQQNKARRILELYEDNDGNAFPSQRGTAYNLLNAFTNFVDHESSVRQIETETIDQARARSALFGIGEVLKFQILQLITQKTAVSLNSQLISIDN